MKLRYLVSFAAGAALLLGACGGDDDDDTTTSNDDRGSESTAASDATKAGEQSGSSDSATKAPEPTKAAEPTKAPATETADSVFDRLASQAAMATYQAKYDVAISLSGMSQKGTATFASKAPKFAGVIKLPDLGDVSVSLINDGTNAYVCTNFGAGGTCSKDNTLAGGGIDVKKALDEAKNGKDVKEIAKRTIAERSARCFEATDAKSGTKMTFCLDEKDSITLYSKIGDVTEMTATEVSATVDEKLFELPFPVS